MTTCVAPERLEKFRSATIGYGSHATLKDAGCINEWLAYLAGEVDLDGKPTDAPACVCPTIRRLTIRINDRFGNSSVANERRRKFFTEEVTIGCLNTRSTPEVEAKRQQMISDWTFTVGLPELFRRAGLGEHADAIATNKDWPTVRKARDAAWQSAGYKGYWAWRDALREKVREAVKKQLADKPAAVDAAAAAAAAAVAAVDVAAAVVAAVAVDAVDAVDAVAVVAVAAAAAAAAAAVAAVDVAAAAAAAVDAVDVAAAGSWSKNYDAAYSAAYKVFFETFEKHPAFQFSKELEAKAQQLVIDLCAVTPESIAA